MNFRAQIIPPCCGGAWQSPNDNITERLCHDFPCDFSELPAHPVACWRVSHGLGGNKPKSCRASHSRRRQNGCSISERNDVADHKHSCFSSPPATDSSEITRARQTMCPIEHALN
jgi:hypothetical protein